MIRLSRRALGQFRRNVLFARLYGIIAPNDNPRGAQNWCN